MQEFLSLISPYVSFLVFCFCFKLVMTIVLFILIVRYLVIVPRELCSIRNRLNTIDENIYVISEKDS